MCVCTVLQLLALACIGKDQLSALTFIYVVWGAAFITLSILRYEFPVNMPMHLYNSPQILAIFGFMVFGLGYLLGLHELFHPSVSV